MAIVSHMALALATCVFTSGSLAEGGAPKVDGRDLVSARLIVDRRAASPGGAFRAGVLFRSEPGWHIYWRHSGTSGLPTEIQWYSEQATFEDTRYPTPSVFVASESVTYGYEEDVLLMSEARVSPGLHRCVGISARAQFLVCKVRCIPGEIRLSKTITVSGQDGPELSADAPLFEQFTRKLPVRPEVVGVVLHADYSVDSLVPGESFAITVTATACVEADRACPREVKLAGGLRSVVLHPPDTMELHRPGTENPDGQEMGLQNAFHLSGRVLLGATPPAEFHVVIPLLLDGLPVAVETTLRLPPVGSVVEREHRGKKISSRRKVVEALKWSGF